jgi:protein TonB
VVDVAVPYPSPPVLHEPGGHRTAAIATSVLGHALLIAGLLLAGRFVAKEVEEEPVRLVFTEPAPPPKLGSPTGGAASAPAPAADEAPAAAPQPQQREALEWVAEPAMFPPKPKPEPAPQPKPVAKAVPKPQPVPQKPAPLSASTSTDTSNAPDATTAGPRGSADGVAAGVEGGLPGGQVGGLGTDLTPLSKAAVAPTIAHRVVPRYPEAARARGIEGQVVIEAVIARDGAVEPGVKIIQSIPALDEAAIEAFRQWRFTPGRDASGKPLRVILQAPVRFVLR